MNERASKRVSFTLSGVELELAKAYAAKYEMTLSEAAKWCLMDEVQSERYKDAAAVKYGVVR